MDEYPPLGPLHQAIPHYAPPTLQTPGREPKGKRKQVGRACSQCAAAHVACSDHRPCNRCARRGIACTDRERKRRRRLDKDSEGEDPMMATAGYMVPGPHHFLPPMNPMYLPPMVGHFQEYFPEFFNPKNLPYDDKSRLNYVGGYDQSPVKHEGGFNPELYGHPDLHPFPYGYPPVDAGYGDIPSSGLPLNQLDHFPASMNYMNTLPFGMNHLGGPLPASSLAPPGLLPPASASDLVGIPLDSFTVPTSPLLHIPAIPPPKFSPQSNK